MFPVAILILPLTSSFCVGRVIPSPTAPLFLMTNCGTPEDEAVKRSPMVLSTISDAKEDLAEILAVAPVPKFPLTSNAVNGVVVPIPTLPPKLLVPAAEYKVNLLVPFVGAPKYNV